MEINRGSTVCPRFIHGLSTVYPWFVHGSVGMWAYETAESMSVFWRGNQQGLKGKKQLFYKDGLFYSRGSPGLTIYIYVMSDYIFSLPASWISSWWFVSLFQEVVGSQKAPQKNCHLAPGICPLISLGMTVFAGFWAMPVWSIFP